MLHRAAVFRTRLKQARTDLQEMEDSVSHAARDVVRLHSAEMEVRQRPPPET